MGNKVNIQFSDIYKKSLTPKVKLKITESQLNSLKENLNSKGEKMLIEYSYDELDRKYSGMSKDRKDNLTNWAKDRQIRNGILVKSNDNDAKIYIIPKDITISNNDGRKILSNYNEYKKKYNREISLADFLQYNGNDSDNFSFSFDARDSVYLSDSKSTVNVEITLTGKLIPLNDKDFPKLKFKVNYTLIEYGGSGRLIVNDRKGSNILIKRLKELFIGKYGKYFNPNSGSTELFIPEIEIHPNSIIA